MNRDRVKEKKALLGMIAGLESNRVTATGRFEDVSMGMRTCCGSIDSSAYLR